MKIILSALLAGTALFTAGAATAQDLPAATPLPAPIPPSQDIPYPGTMTIQVDTTKVAQGYFTVHQTIPVAAAGSMTILYPEWKPGNHSPSGQIMNLAGLKFSANGLDLPWRRDTVNMFAFHLDVPAGVKTITADFQYLSPLEGGGDRVMVAPTMLNIDWDQVSLYPAGYYVRRIKVTPSVTYPAGWTGFTALRGAKAGETVSYDTVAYDTLIDFPVFAGAHTKQIALDPAMSLDLVADTEDELAITPEQIDAHKAMVVQADKLFGARHYDHYDLLVAMSDYQSGEGLEHHRSSENSLDGDFLTHWEDSVADRYTVAHEYTHSWNGKFRRPFDLWTPDYHTPMQDSLLWVYEGQTQLWGDVLAARSGLWSKQEYLDMLAMVAANYSEATPGDSWRPLQDTTNAPILSEIDNAEWTSWVRSADYYRNAELIWIEADQIIREQSAGARGLDDFAKGFFGVRPGDWSEMTYTFDDVVAALNAVQPYDWAGFLRTRLDGTSPTTTLAGIEKGGYKLVFDETPTKTEKAVNAARKRDEYIYSIGISVAKGKVGSVLWRSPAFGAGLRPHDTIVAVGGLVYTPERLRAAITAAKTDKAPITLIVETDDRYRTVSIDYHNGLRYPRLERTSTGEAGLDRLIAAK